MHYTHREVRYHEDVASLFAHVGGLEARDAVLLESADITTRSGLQSVAVLRASLRVTCTGTRVTVEPLTPSGGAIAADLGLDEYRVAEHTYDFPPAAATDERERLTAASTADVLRALTTRAGYGNGVFPLLAGGFAFDYLDSFEQLPPVAEGPNTYPDYQFVLAEVLLRVDHEAGTASLEGVGTTAIDLEELAQRIDAAPPWPVTHPKPMPVPSETATEVASSAAACTAGPTRAGSVSAGAISTWADGSLARSRAAREGQSRVALGRVPVPSSASTPIIERRSRSAAWAEEREAVRELSRASRSSSEAAREEWRATALRWPAMTSCTASS